MRACSVLRAPCSVRGNSWELMGTRGNLWELMGTCGSLWELVGTCGNLWELMGTLCVRTWELMRSCGNLWETLRVGTYGSLGDLHACFYAARRFQCVFVL